MTRRVFITGYGIITSIGNNRAENFQSLTARKCGYGSIDLIDTRHRSLGACEIKHQDAQLAAMASVDENSGFTRTALLGLIAIKEAIQQAALSANELARSGLISATTTGGIRELEKYYYDLMDASKEGGFTIFTDTANPGEHTERIAETLGIRAYCSTISTACSSSANAIITGAQLIAHHQLDKVICGGAEALSKFTINGFNALMILSSEQCKPFDQNRSGLNLGEGAAYLVLESEDAFKGTGRIPLAELKGWGNANDAFHLTASSPEGAGAFNAMSKALISGEITVAEVDYINAHGTATENNDLSEGLAMQKLFGKNIPPFSSTKPYTGHTLAAAGSVEAVFSILALQNGVVFPNINFNQKMEELTISPEMQLREHTSLKYVLSNSFGFGGNTSSLLFASVLPGA